jgi:hypothetical protein
MVVFCSVTMENAGFEDENRRAQPSLGRRPRVILLHRKVNQGINENETIAKLLRGKLCLNSGSAKTGTTPETGCWPGFRLSGVYA